MNFHDREDDPGRSVRILLIDDDPAVDLVGQAVLVSAGFEYHRVTSGEVALACIPELQPDLVLLDIVMPGMNGFETCEAIKRLPETRDVPVIMLTGNDDTESVSEAYRKGAWDFTSKPINWPILVNRCRHAIEASRAFAEARKASRLSRVLDNSHNEIVTFDPHSLVVLDMNDGAAIRWHGASDSNKRCVDEPFVGFDRAKFMSVIEPIRKDEPQVSFTAELRNRDGSSTPCEVLILRSDEDPARTVYVAIIQDISDRLRNQREVHNLQFYDALTGLPNRRFAIQSIEQTLSLAALGNRVCALMLLDLDSFKLVNDALGHRRGDEILKTIAYRLGEVKHRFHFDQGERGAGIQVARLGGDEFLLFVSDMTDPVVVRLTAEEVLASLRLPISIDEHEITLTGSMGIAMYPGDGQAIDDLLKNADSAMYKAKSQGKNTYRYHSETDSLASLEFLTTETQLRQALERDELFVAYQVQVDNQTRKICGLEALARWKHPEKGLVPPGQFIPVAEESSLIVDVGNWVMTQVLEDSRDWLSSLLPPDVELGVNVSSRHLENPQFLSSMGRMLEENQPAHRIVVEITESSLMADRGSPFETLQALRDMGLFVAIDDFGTGYSSLSYLKDLPVDSLKVDQSFIVNIEHSTQDLNIVKIIFNLADMLGLRVIAEGVENEQQAALLDQCGDYVAQGYLYSRPLSRIELTELLTAWPLGTQTA